MLKVAEPGTEKRCDLLKFLSEKNVSYSSRITIIEPMDGQIESEKERIAERLLNVIKDCKTEKEMIAKAMKLR